MTEYRSSPHSRREFLSAGAALFATPACAERRAPAVGVRAVATDEADELDAAYERLAARFPDASVHAANHAPMVAEALSVLGRAGAIAPWLDGSLGEFQRAPETGERVDPADWRATLGHNSGFAAWQALFLGELAHDDWQLVLRRWVPRLAPGLAGAATHGLIRTGHGARALVARDNAVRRRELATGLAYWAITYQKLPWNGIEAPEPSVEAAFAKLEPRLPAVQPPGGNFVAGLSSLSETPSFQSAAGRIDTRDPLRTLSEMSTHFAHVFLCNPERRIAFTHSLTAPSALRLLAPHLDEETVRVGVRYAWQAAAGLYVVYGDPRRGAPAERALLERDVLVQRAIDSGDAHAIKLSEAALREHALTHDSTPLRAAQDLVESLS